jgi:hypothetical protein
MEKEEEEGEEGGNTMATTSMSRRTSLDTVDFDANYGEMRHLQFSHDEEEDSRTEPRQQDILTGNHNLPKQFYVLVFSFNKLLSVLDRRLKGTVSRDRYFSKHFNQYFLCMR